MMGNEDKMVDSDSEPELHVSMPLMKSRGDGTKKTKNGGFADESLERPNSTLLPASPSGSQKIDCYDDMITAEFDIKAIEEKDFHGIKMLLKQMFHADMNEYISEWAELILKQWEYVGSTIKIVDQDEVYGVTSIINLNTHADKQCVIALKAYILDKCPALMKPQLTNLFGSDNSSNNNKKVGLVISERFSNIPYDIVPPLYQVLTDEIQSAIVDGEPFEFTDFILFSKCYTPLSEPAKRTKDGKRIANHQYMNLEDRLFSNAPTAAHFMINIPFNENEQHKIILDDQKVQLQREINIINMSAWDTITRKMPLLNPLYKPPM